MPKMKTKAGAKKRFKLTGSGKLKRKQAFKSHILTKKETKQKHNLTKTEYVTDNILTLPLFSSLSLDKLQYITECIKSFFDEF